MRAKSWRDYTEDGSADGLVSANGSDGVIPDDAKFQLALPENWNGKLAIFSRGFSGTELSTGSFKTSALEKGYAFVARGEGWNRLTIASRPQDSYYESRRRIWELTLYAKQILKTHYGKGPTPRSERRARA